MVCQLHNSIIIVQVVVIVEKVIPAVQEKDHFADQGNPVDEQVPHSELAAERLMTNILKQMRNLGTKQWM